MKGRSFGVHNKVYPIAVRRLERKCPPCFDEQTEVWLDWLAAEWRRVLDDDAKRVAMVQRGVHASPCEDCTVAFQEEMERRHRCEPADFDLTPKGKEKATA